MSVKNIWEVCEFEDEVIYGNLKAERFAVELHQVLEGRAAELYLSPRLFLSHTYPTETMKYLLREALRRLSGRGGQPVFILDTEFGGGKTHTLLLLYYVFKDREVGTAYIRELNLHKETGVLEVPECRVLAIDCRMVKRNTLWGEIAAGLGRYDDFKEEDLRMMPVKDIGRLKSLFDKPTLILLDELPHYLLNAEAVKVGDTNLCTLTISFILTLISAVSATENSMLIITMTGRQRLYEEYVKRVKRRIDELLVEKVDSALREAFSRQAQYLTPIRKEEVAHVLKKRLIKRIKDPRAVEEIARSYYDYLSRKGLIADLAYEDRIKESYPFHPFLIDILYERVSTIEQFNKTRGIFRLLGLMLHRIYRDKRPCQLLSPGDILLDDLEIMEELTSRLGREGLKTVIETDCIEKARRLDEKRSVKLVERVARTIFLYSLIGAERISGALPRDIKLGACYPGLEPDLVDEVLDEIDREFWYIRSEGGAYYFQTEPNINKIIYDYMSEVRDDEIREAIRKELGKLFSTDREIDRQAKVVIWDRHELRDDDRLKIFVVDYRDVIGRDERAVIEELIEKDPSGGIRRYRNTVVLVLPEMEGVQALEDSARKLCAAEKAEKDERIKPNKELVRKAKERQARYQGDLASDCRNTYSKIAYPRMADGQIIIEHLELGETAKSLTSLVLDALARRGKLITDSLSPEAVREVLAGKGIMRVEEVYEIFTRDRSKPFILTGEVIIEAVRNGVRRGLFGYSDELEEHDGRYRAKIGREATITWDGYIIEEDKVYREEAELKEPEKRPAPPPIAKPIYRRDYSLESLRDVLDKIAVVRAAAVGRRFTINLNLEIEDDRRCVRMIIECRDWNRIGDVEKLIQSIQGFKGYSGRGSMSIETDDQGLLEDLRELEG